MDALYLFNLQFEQTDFNFKPTDFHFELTDLNFEQSDFEFKQTDLSFEPTDFSFEQTEINFELLWIYDLFTCFFPHSIIALYHTPILTLITTRNPLYHFHYTTSIKPLADIMVVKLVHCRG